MRVVVIGMLITIALSTAMPPVEVARSATVTTRAGQSAAGEDGRVAEALAANERILLPVVDHVLEDVEAVGITGQPAYAAVADSASAPAVDETFVRRVGGATLGRHRMGLSRAPSGNVVGAVLRYRASTADRSAVIRVHLFDGQRMVARGPRHVIRPDQGWVDLVDDITDVFVSSAENLAVEVRLGSREDGGGDAAYSSLAVQVALEVSLSFRPTALHGGAVMSSVAAQPPPSGTVIAGSSSLGLYRSADRAHTFTARNAAMHIPHRLAIAGVAVHPTRDGVAYAITMPDGMTRALLRSKDDGRTWRAVSGIPTVSPESAAGDAAGRGPRPPYGALLAIHGRPRGPTTIWAATENGVLRSRDGGKTWVVIGLEGVPVRGLARHPADSDVLYAVTDGSGTWVTSAARAPSTTFAQVPGGPDVTEEATIVDGTLFVAGGAEGIYRLGPDGHLVATNEGVPLGLAEWTGIAGYASGGRTVVFASCDPCQPEVGGATASIIRSVDGGDSWHSVTGPAAVDLRVAGDGEPWALAAVRPELVPGHADFDVLQLLAHPPSAGHDGVVLAATNGGIWRSVDEGERWSPTVVGLGGSGSTGLAGDPAAGGRIFHGVVGLGSLSTRDAFDHVTFESLDPSLLADMQEPVAFDAAFDTTTRPSTVAVALGDARRRAGEVFLGSPDATTTWRSTGFGTDAPDLRPTAISVGHLPDGQRVIVAAAHPGGGILRKVADGAWERVRADGVYVDRQGAREADLAWVAGTQTLYLFDPARGIWRSQDAAKTWALVWAIRSNQPGASGLAVGPDPDVLFVASNQGVHRLDDATTGSVEDGGVRLTQLGTFRRASDVMLDPDGRLWAVSEIGAGAPARIAVSWDPFADDPQFMDLAPRDYVDTVIRPDSIHVTDEGTVLIADRLFGTFRGDPSDVRVDAWLPPGIKLHAVEWSEGRAGRIQPLNEAVVGDLGDPFIVHVAPDGNDGHDGSGRDQAVLTLGRAQAILSERFGDDARGLRSDVLVVVHAGRYVGQSTTWTFTHPVHVVRIAGSPDQRTVKPTFVGCDEPGCASARTWFVLRSSRGEASNIQLLNLRVTRYLRAIIFSGGTDLESGWNGSNIVHRCEFSNIGTRYFADITPDVWSPAIIALRNSRGNRIWQNRFSDSSNRMDHANEWFHTIYASHGASDNSVRFNRIINTSGDFHIRNGSDRNVFSDNVIRDSFYWAIVTEWSSEVETDSCETEVTGNIWIGDWYCEFEREAFHRETAAPDGRCQREDLRIRVIRANRHRPAGSACIPG